MGDSVVAEHSDGVPFPLRVEINLIFREIRNKVKYAGTLVEMYSELPDQNH